MGNGDDESGTHRPWTRRQWMIRSAVFGAAALSAPGCISALRGESDAPDDTECSSDADLSTWEGVRRQFDTDPDLIHMAGMLLATHPESVRRAIEDHRRGLDDNPYDYLFSHWARSEDRLDDDAEQWAMQAASDHLDVSPAHVALTHNTTTGLSVVYHGLDIDSDQEVLSAHWNHWATEGSIDYAAQKRGFSTRRAHLVDDLQSVSQQQLADRLIDAIAPETRVVAATWIHSDTGLKLPVGEIGRRIDELNQGRAPNNRILYCVDAVHGLGVEDANFADLHCDFYIAGCHKWLFGPRGTGIIVGRPNAWQHATPTVPTFSMSITPGRRFTPGGFHAFEHRWALHRAFAFHREIGTSRIEARIHELTGRLVEELDALPRVHLTTPRMPGLRSGIVVFRVEGQNSYEVVDHLRRHDIIASISTGDVRQPRLAPGLLNDHSHIDAVVEALREL